VIIRILTEGQYDVADHALDRLNELDTEVERAVEAGDEAAFATALATLLDGVRSAGVAHPADSLDESDLILPPADATIDEVRQMLNDDGLIPG
jgi:PspAA-like protein